MCVRVSVGGCVSVCVVRVRNTGGKAKGVGSRGPH